MMIVAFIEVLPHLLCKHKKMGKKGGKGGGLQKYAIARERFTHSPTRFKLTQKGLEGFGRQRI